MDDPIKNFTKTNDPNVYLGKKGALITRQEFEQANKNGYAWKTFEDYADYVGGWAGPVKPVTPAVPYYRAYAQKEPINGGDVAILMAKNNPAINKILARNIAPKGEVPMYGSEDADAIRALITKEKLTAQASHHGGEGMYNAMKNAAKNK